MSHARKCDRCDEFYELTPGVITIDIHTVTAVDEGEVELEVEAGVGLFCTLRRDFCPSCSRSLKDFIDTAPAKAA